jgi:hypothetical protein
MLNKQKLFQYLTIIGNIMNIGVTDEGIEDFQRRTACTSLIFPRPYVKCGSVFVSSPKDEKTEEEFEDFNKNIR